MYDLEPALENSNPHGVFFDFNSHLTPRIWIAHRNVARRNAQVQAIGNLGKLSYFDVLDEKLVTYDLADLRDSNLKRIEDYWC